MDLNNFMQAAPGVQLGHGDCLELMRGIPEGSIDMVMTDPPYGTTSCKWDAVIDLAEMWAELKRVVKPSGAIVLMAAQPFTSVLICSNLKMFKYAWVWDKMGVTGFLNAKKQPLRASEDVCVFYRKQPTYNPQMRLGFKPYHIKAVAKPVNKPGTVYRALKSPASQSDDSRYPINLLAIKRDPFRIHPTQKPEALMAYMVKTYANAGETVLDFTMGSGTTGVACVNTGREFIGIERDSAYFSMAAGRILGAVK